MNTVEKYFEQFEPSIQERLEQIRSLVKSTYPACKESISYKIIAFRLNKNYLYLAAFKNHIGIYPLLGLEKIENLLEPYRAKGAKSSLHFKHHEELPLVLIKKVIQHRLEASA
ncbi:MAG: DUF1801 domain-containing protein [Chitinophagales bacterium]|nr:DUF1801 domain-containing protein [Bacteroidota bacterium]MCB9257318.1 DUF1801 domain-containing protein [Chitinophagales bacterium]